MQDKKICKWSKLVDRSESVLMLDYLIRGLPALRTKKVLGLEKGFERYLYLDKSIFWDAKEAQEVVDYLNNLIKKRGYSFLRILTSKCVAIGEILLKLGERLGQEDNVKKDNSQLLSDFITFSQQNWKLSSFLLLPLVMERIFSTEIEVLLNKKGLSETKKRKYLAVLSFPKKDSFFTKELISFYNLVSIVQVLLKNKKWNINNITNALSEGKGKQGIEEYLQNFSWIGARWYLGDGWTRNDIIERIDKIKSDKNYKDKVKELKDYTSKNNLKTLNIINELNLSKKEIELIETAKEYVFIRTYRTDVFNKAGFLARPFLSEIAKRFSLSFEQLIFLTSKEIIQGLRGKEMEEIISKIKSRQKSFVALLKNREIIIYEGNDVEIFKKEQRIDKIPTTIQTKVLLGTSDNSGKVIGRAKIIKEKKELNKIKKGDILVTNMTGPDYILAMEQAAAFITDEGGITCHAAIISREMNKPCVIGTKIATQVLKDGDKIEIDANKGTVKKI